MVNKANTCLHFRLLTSMTQSTSRWSRASSQWCSILH